MSLLFLKLGGSLITEKQTAETPRHDVLKRLAREIAEARRDRPDLDLVLGHGSGSFGHVSARRHGTRGGVRSAAEWFGFAATADAAARLTRIVAAHLLRAGLPAWSLQPGVALRCRDGRVLSGPEETVRLALERGLLPLIHGDVALDSMRGGTVASTEEIFEQMAVGLAPTRIVLAGEVEGVFSGDPMRNRNAALVGDITPETFTRMGSELGASHATDVTGGMAAKVEQAVRMVRSQPQLEVIICGGRRQGVVYDALTSPAKVHGTRIHAGRRPSL